MAYVNLNRDTFIADDGNDSKVIIRDLADVPGGRALDVTGWTAETISAGHIIKVNTATGEYAPLGVNGNEYATLGSNEKYVGVLKASVLAKKAFAAIMTMGEVNASASPYPVNEDIVEALPGIVFLGNVVASEG